MTDWILSPDQNTLTRGHETLVAHRTAGCGGCVFDDPPRVPGCALRGRINPPEHLQSAYRGIFSACLPVQRDDKSWVIWIRRPEDEEEGYD